MTFAGSVPALARGGKETLFLDYETVMQEVEGQVKPGPKRDGLNCSYLDPIRMPEPSARETPMTLSVTFFFDPSVDADVVAVATVVTAVTTALTVAERESVVDILMAGYVA